MAESGTGGSRHGRCVLYANEHEGTQRQKGLAESSRLRERTRQGTRSKRAIGACVRLNALRCTLFCTAQRYCNTKPIRSSVLKGPFTARPAGLAGVASHRIAHPRRAQPTRNRETERGEEGMGRGVCA